MLAHRNDSSKLRQNAMYEGYIVDLLEQLALLVNFRYRLVPVWDGEYGAWKNRKWDGMIGEVVRRVSCACALRDESFRSGPSSQARGLNDTAAHSCRPYIITSDHKYIFQVAIKEAIFSIRAFVDKKPVLSPRHCSIPVKQ